MCKDGHDMILIYKVASWDIEPVDIELWRCQDCNYEEGRSIKEDSYEDR